MTTVIVPTVRLSLQQTIDYEMHHKVTQWLPKRDRQTDRLTETLELSGVPCASRLLVAMTT